MTAINDDTEIALVCRFGMVAVAVLALVLSVRVYTGSITDQEAIKAGLVQDKGGHWVKPSDPANSEVKNED